MLQLFRLDHCYKHDDADGSSNSRLDMNVIARKIEDESFDVELFNQMIKHDCGFIVRSSDHEI